MYSSKEGEEQEDSSDTSKECVGTFNLEVVIHQDEGSGVLHD